MIHTALLARMTDWVEQGHGLGFVEYISTERKHRFEVEHIWANHPDRHTAEVPDPRDFANQRNKFGDLVLLPKDFNASHGVGITQQKGWLGHTGTLPGYNTGARVRPEYGHHDRGSGQQRHLREARARSGEHHNRQDHRGPAIGPDRLTRSKSGNRPGNREV